MNASIEGSLKNLNKVYQFFEHNGKTFSKQEVKTILTYAKNKGYKTTGEIQDIDVLAAFIKIKK